MKHSLPVSLFFHILLLFFFSCAPFSRIKPSPVFTVDLLDMDSPRSFLPSVPVLPSLPDLSKEAPTAPFASGKSSADTRTPSKEATPALNRISSAARSGVRQSVPLFSEEEYRRSLRDKLAGVEEKTSSSEYVSLPRTTTQSPSSGATALPDFPTTGLLAPDLPEEYLVLLRERIMKYWLLPSGHLYNRVAVVSFRLYNNGRSQNIILEKSSRDRSFDASVMNAIKGVPVFPPFPRSVRRERVDVTVTFNGRGIE
ncbi:MAG: energy transducer TonB [Candidatus Ratteibacteria bacterium]|jgi:TonB family protein